MGRLYLMMVLVGSYLLSPVSLHGESISYDGPYRLVRFQEQQDPDSSGVGFIREGMGHGPLRLLVSDKGIHLLARLDHAAYTFDFTGNLIDSIYFDFCPGDMTFDPQGRFHVLQYRVQPQFVATFQDGVEVERRYFDLPGDRLMTEIAYSPAGEIVVANQGYTYRLVEGNNRYQLEPAGERPGRYQLVTSHVSRPWLDFQDSVRAAGERIIPETDIPPWKIRFVGKTTSGVMPTFTVDPERREIFQFHTDDDQGRIYVIGTFIIEDQEGNPFVDRRMIVAQNGIVEGELGNLAAGHSSYDFANHDIAVAPNGDIYMFRTHWQEKYSEIVFWRLTTP